MEAWIIAMACGAPPDGYGRWSVRLLAARCVEFGIVPDISHMTVARLLKNEYKPHLKKCWCIPPEQNAAFVAAMVDVLEVYARPYDPDYPVVCMDEKPLLLFASPRRSLRSKDGRIEYEDSEYIRNGTAGVFLFTEPLRGWRKADAQQEHRTREDWRGKSDGCWRSNIQTR